MRKFEKILRSTEIAPLLDCSFEVLAVPAHRKKLRAIKKDHSWHIYFADIAVYKKKKENES